MNSDELKEAFRKLPPREDDPDEQSWNHRAFRIREHVENEETELMLQWSTIEGTMFVADAPYIRMEFEELMSEDFPRRWEAAIHETGFGGAPRLPYHKATSGNMVHQAYHLLQFEKIADEYVDNFDSIFEFGGGYGAMAKVIHELGFNDRKCDLNERYVMFDLPEMSLIQKYYLSNVGCSDVECVDVLEEGNYDLFIACYSLSETCDADFMKDVLIKARASNYLVVFTDVYDGFDNMEFFMDMIKHSPLTWTIKRIPHTTFENCWYLIGA